MSLIKPNKHLEYDEHHFEGYWVRLMALVRQNDAADEILDQMVISVRIYIFDIYLYDVLANSYVGIVVVCVCLRTILCCSHVLN